MQVLEGVCWCNLLPASLESCGWPTDVMSQKPSALCCLVYKIRLLCHPFPISTVRCMNINYFIHRESSSIVDRRFLREASKMSYVSIRVVNGKLITHVLCPSEIEMCGDMQSRLACVGSSRVQRAACSVGRPGNCNVRVHVAGGQK